MGKRVLWFWRLELGFTSAFWKRCSLINERGTEENAQELALQVGRVENWAQPELDIN